VTTGTELVALLRDVGHSEGLVAVGIAGAESFDDCRSVLEERKAAGLHGGMQFTYRNPARSTEPARALPGAASLIVGALSYKRNDIDAPPKQVSGRVARYAWRDWYEPLRRSLHAMAVVLEDHGYRARVLADDNALVDRAAAQRAGIGWFGKNANVLLPGQGSWFVLGSVVTDAHLPADEPVADGCGSCDRCLTSCPTGAIVAPGVVDGRRCLAWLVQAPGVFPVEHREALGDRLYGCDDCQEVCPPNRRAARVDLTTDRHAAAGAWVDVVGLLHADDAQLMDRFGRWYIPRREPRYLRRNALVVLGNIGDGADPSVERAVAVSLASPDPIVRAHAVWAARRLGLHGLVEQLLADEHDPVVMEEVGRVVASRLSRGHQ
jgi:epoxyqueuosine reductase